MCLRARRATTNDSAFSRQLEAPTGTGTSTLAILSVWNSSPQAKRLELPEFRQLLELADGGTCTGVEASLQWLLAEEIVAVERQLRALTLLQGQLREARDHVDRPRPRRVLSVRVCVQGVPGRGHFRGLITRIHQLVSIDVMVSAR